MMDWRQERRETRWAKRSETHPSVDGSTFQRPLEELSIALTHLLEREGAVKFPASSVSDDIAMILRQLTYTYDLLFYLNSDDKRSGQDPGYRLGYSFVALPLIRTMIDGFYNITAMLEDTKRARLFRLAGYRRLLLSLQADQQRYGKVSKWKDYIVSKRHECTVDYRMNGFTTDEIKTGQDWLTLPRFLTARSKKTKHVKMLASLALSVWEEYSAISHVTFQGLKGIFPFLTLDRQAPALREQTRIQGDLLITTHLGRAASLLAAALTEIQATYKFEGHRLPERIESVWEGILPIFGVMEFYEYRYKELIETEIRSSDKASKDSSS